MTSHVTDPESIKYAEKGLYTGYSPAIRSQKTADLFLNLINAHEFEAAEALKSQSQGILIKDVPDPVVLSVTLTRKPCLHASKYCKLKDNGVKMSEESNIKSKILEAIGMSDAADVESLKSEVFSFKAELDAFKEENNEALKSLKEEVVSEFKASLKEFADKSNNEGEEGEEEGGEPQDIDEQPPQTPEGEEEEEEEEPHSGNDGSKQGSNHNNGADKSQEDFDTYEFLGRYPDGTCKQY